MTFLLIVAVGTVLGLIGYMYLVPQGKADAAKVEAAVKDEIKKL